VKKVFGTRRRVVIVAMVLALVVSGSALAAWIIFTGATGSSTGKFGASTNGGAAVTIVAGHTQATCSAPGTTCDLITSMTNNAGVAEQIVAAASQPANAVSFTSTPVECASHLTLNSAYAGTSVPANATSSTDVTLTGLLKVDATLPATCSNGTFTATLNLATTP
jgi:hypothetical protein